MRSNLNKKAASVIPATIKAVTFDAFTPCFFIIKEIESEVVVVRIYRTSSMLRDS